MEKHTDTLVLSETTDGVCHLTLNRPDKFNALSSDMLAALMQALDAVEQDSSVRCVVLGALGKAFCAGHDFREMQANRSRDWYVKLFKDCGLLMQRIVALPVSGHRQG